MAQALLHFLTDMFLGKLESVDFDYENVSTSIYGC